MDIWFTSKVFFGEKIGRTLGFPTINLDPSVFPKDKKEGVYGALIRYKNKIYIGALYFGKRLILNKNNKVLEIYILDFKKNIYGEKINFQIKNFVRPPRNFSSKEKFISQLKNDIKKISDSVSL